jgi:hypothetical protein
MKLLVATVATATVLTFAFRQAPPVLAQEADIGASSRPFPLNGGSSSRSDDRGQSSGEPSQGTERSGDVSSEKSQTRSETTGETLIRGHRVVIHKHSRRIFALSHSRHRLLIHRHGHRVVALNEPSGV